MTDLEKIARAIYECHEFVKPWDRAHCWHDICHKEARAARRAVLEWLMEPGEEVLRAGSTTLAWRFGETELPEEARLCWQAMIRHIMEQDEKEE